ncbi:hypothetical protein [Caulobacter sp. FWC2]|uniref:hypothetical protein n=1 Tax=Caulobacter sp. FWC2 TaxID=69664 RepID=UPI000C146A4B|nr:hypothetical protein [Caulobacter sp. FWC2]PIB92457.1 hypothetical protein CSW62_13315 [Caulobacter sp. FWC2]
MSALNAPSSWRQADRGASGRADGHDTMIGFSISPTGSGTWAWRACDQSGRVRAQGVAGSRKLAAALVIHHIVSTRAERVASSSPETRAKAA